MLLTNVGRIFPGDTNKLIPIKFLCSDLVLPKLQIGTKFYIREGRIIGEGEIREIFNRG